MSLSTWIRDYLFVSLGGSKQSGLRTSFNLILTMTLCGLWHGASCNCILWGVYNGVLLAGHRLWDRSLSGLDWAERLRSQVVYRTLAVASTFFLFVVGLTLFRSTSWANCWLMESSLCAGPAEGTCWLPTFVPLLVGLVVAGHLFSGLRGLRCGVLELPPLLRSFAYVTSVMLVVTFSPESTKAFVYFQF